jgi:hypothetical protein
MEAAVARLPQHMDVFTVGTDGGVYSTWWDVGANGGRWNPRFRIPGNFVGRPGSPVTVLSREPDHLDLFAVGADGRVYSAWWDARVNNGMWNDWFVVPGGFTAPPGATVTALARSPEHMDLFAVGNDGRVYSDWWDAGVNNGLWNDWFVLPGSFAGEPGSPVTAVSRTPEHMDVFAVGNDGRVYSDWWDARVNNGLWNDWFVIPGSFAGQLGSPVTVLSRTPEHMDLFAVGNDGRVHNAWWDARVNNGLWNDWFVIPGNLSAPPGATVTALARSPDHMDLFVVGNDTGVSSAWWDANVNNGMWNSWFGIPGGFSGRPGSVVTALARTPDHMDLFAVGGDGGVYSAWWDANANGGLWNDWFRTPGALTARPGAPVDALTRSPEHMDLFAVDINGGIYSAWWDARANNGQWNNWFPLDLSTQPQTTMGVTPAPGSGMAALARLPQHQDAFSVGADGAVYGWWWDVGANGGRWNPRYRIPGNFTGVPGSPVNVLSREPDHLDLFAVGADGRVYSAWWDARVNNGLWNDWFVVPGSFTAPPGATVTALARSPEHMDLFAVANDGRVYNAWWDAGVNNGQWNDWFTLPGSFTGVPGSAVTAVSRTPEHMDVFAVGNDGQVHNVWWDSRVNSGHWNDWFVIPGSFAGQPGSPVTVLSRTPEHMDLFAVGNDGRVHNAWWDSRVNKGMWNDWFVLPGNVQAPPGAPVTALARSPDHMDLFVVGDDGRAYSAWWDAGVNNGRWNDWFLLPGTFTAPPGATIMAVARTPLHMDLFAVGDDGRGYSAWWDAHANNGLWNNWFVIPGKFAGTPGSAVVALSRIPGHMDVFALGADGGPYSAWWDATANNGQWNDWFGLSAVPSGNGGGAPPPGLGGLFPPPPIPGGGDPGPPQPHKPGPKSGKHGRHSHRPRHGVRHGKRVRRFRGE